ncbi:class I SAM-dependent methyltransferase [Inquilinus ginsengisoli]|uniref:class I SAM-dependent methyltransferase n=1 Tax=Inquilinus ginsengisoli TaxID=363840 RepID=UPI00286B62EE|nr:class I SAM-dependent methyltransferase [Inquilinus ginsengisoli]
MSESVRCLTPTSFIGPRHLSPSAWLEHAPFAFWLIEAIRPRVVVELGTHTGFSYLCFCQAVQQFGIPARCYAVDTWVGDDHAGFYGEGVFGALSAINSETYTGFSNLLRMRFDEALPYFSDGEVDLLHIDGRHGYEDVRRDFETWLPKLSDRAVVLFHDTNVREREFGVWRLWQEISGSHPSFEFVHGHGLGVLAVGRDMPDGIRPLFDSNDAETRAGVQVAYARLGAAVTQQHRAQALRSELTDRQADLAQAREHLATRESEADRLRGDVSAREGELDRLRQEAAARASEAAARLAEMDLKKTALEQQKVALEQQQKVALEQQKVALEQQKAALEQQQRLLASVEARNRHLDTSLSELAQANARLRSAVEKQTEVLARKRRRRLGRTVSKKIARPVRNAMRSTRRKINVFAHFRRWRRRARQQRVLEPQTVSMMAMALPVAARRTEPVPTRSLAVDVIVCVHNAPDDTRRCLDSVIAHTLPPYRIIIVDDGSGDAARELVTRFAQQHGATLIRHDRAQGYTFAANVGLRASTAPWVVLLNSDTIVTEGWIDRMVATAERDPRIGLVGPLSNTASWQSVPHVAKNGDWHDNPLPDDVDVDKMGQLVAQASVQQGMPIPFLNGFCLAVRRATLDDVGLFDEENFGQGYGEENDFCIRARNRGWKLIVADDSYVFHAQSKSYSSERRLALAKRADDTLKRKHDLERDVHVPVLFCRDGLGLAGVRARVEAAMLRDRLAKQGRALWHGRRVGIILPTAEAGGGSNVVLQEARALWRMGVDVSIINFARHRPVFEASYPTLELPCVYAQDEAELRHILASREPGFDVLIATLYASVFWLPEPDPDVVLAYYSQDFEPWFFEKGSAGYQQALASYTARRDVRIFTKTGWNADRIEAIGCPRPRTIGPSVDLDLYRPAPSMNPHHADPVRICAMVRPSSPRRSPELTLDILRRLRSEFGTAVEITTFGDDRIAPDTAVIGDIRQLGAISPGRVATIMEESDIFLDFSVWQAMGLTALEAMASGCAVIGPIEGGAGEFLRHEETGLLVDTRDAKACYAAAARLVTDRDLQIRLRLAAVTEAAKHTPEAAAFRMMSVFFEGTLETSALADMASTG